jgi:hypothetical protein
MHTYSYGTADGTQVYIHHNGDFSGNALVTVQPTGSTAVEVQVPCEALAAFGAEATRDRLIAALEDVELGGSV